MAGYQAQDHNFLFLFRKLSGLSKELAKSCFSWTALHENFTCLLTLQVACVEVYWCWCVLKYIGAGVEVYWCLVYVEVYWCLVCVKV